MKLQKFLKIFSGYDADVNVQCEEDDFMFHIDDFGIISDKDQKKLEPFMDKSIDEIYCSKLYTGDLTIVLTKGKKKGTK